MATYVMKSKEIPVVREVDVLVAGGGYAGFGLLCALRATAQKFCSSNNNLPWEAW